MLFCNNCQRTYQDEYSDGVEKSLGRYYCVHCGTQLSEIDAVQQASKGSAPLASGARSAIDYNPDNSITSNSNNVSNSNNTSTTNNTTNNSNTTITNIYKSEDETVYTKFGEFKKEEVRRCKSCKEYVPITYLVGDTGICQECWIRIQKKEGDSAFGEGLYEESINCYEKVVNAAYGDDDLRQELMFKIGRCYFELKDGKKAISYFAKSKEKYPDSIYYLGRCMELGIGKPKDMEAAKDYYREAARKGSGLARLELEKEEKLQTLSKPAAPRPTPISPQSPKPQVVLQPAPVRHESNNRNYLIAAAVLAVLVIGYFTLGNKGEKEKVEEAPVEQVAEQENDSSTKNTEEESQRTKMVTAKEPKVEKSNAVVSEPRSEASTLPAAKTSTIAATPSAPKQENVPQPVPEQAAPTVSMSDGDLVAQGKKALRAMDYNKAKTSLTQAANHGNTEAIYQLGMLYSNSNFDGYNRETATSYFVKAAKNNHVEAMYQAGMMYLGVDNASAKSWFSKAANAGHNRAEAQLSKLK